MEGTLSLSDSPDNSEQSPILALLARCFISEMDRECLDVMMSDQVLSVLEKISPGISAYMNESEWDNTRLEQLASDYCHVFILPGKKHVSLQMGHWIDKSAFDITNLEKLISDMGFDFDSLKVSKTPNDHLGVLLYFMSSVCSSESEEVSSMYNDLERQLFFWIPPFLRKLSLSTESPFYLACGELLKETLETLKS